MIRNKIFLFLLILVFGFSLSSFDNFSDPQKFLPTKMKITVLDGLGNPNKGATVTLYTNEDDYRSSKNPVQKGKTDEKGKVKFSDLKPISYFIDARNGDMNNNGEGVKTAALLEGRTNKVNTIIE